jgi:seryl-tRNA synthetase
MPTKPKSFRRLVTGESQSEECLKGATPSAPTNSMTASRIPLSACASCRRRVLASFGLRPHSITSRPYTRPPTAPKPTIDIKHIRQAPGLYEQNCIDRNYPAQASNSWRIIELHKQWQNCQREARTLRERNNAIQKLLPQTSDRGVLLEEAKELKSKLGAFEEQEKNCQRQIQELAEELPNLSSTNTPVGNEPEVVGYIGEHPEREGFTQTHADEVWRSHVEIGAELDLLDFSGAATTSGWGWYFLKNEAAMLEQALIQYTLQVARLRGWKFVSPPSMVYAHIAAACGFQPRDQHGEQQIYSLEQAEKDKAKPQLVLAGTAEIPLAGMKAGETFEAADLPLKVIGVNRCYRAEAGARGVDTKGLYRVHEFTKVEMFAWTLPDESTDEHGTGAAFAEKHTSHAEAIFQEMLDFQKHILESLGLHCRILEMPSTDLGASATRKRDIEAFFPSRRAKDGGWGEVTSTSICTDYQTRRLGTRVKIEKPRPRLDFPFTVNGTAMAIPRILACLMERGWNEKEKTLVIPALLSPWMDNKTVITKKGMI